MTSGFMIIHINMQASFYQIMRRDVLMGPIKGSKVEILINILVNNLKKIISKTLATTSLKMQAL